MTASPALPFADPAATWNQRFASDAYHFGTAPNTWLSEQAHIWQPGGRVLCVADGEGRNSVWLAGQGLSVDAFDIADAGVAKAQRLAAARGVTVNYVTADCDAHDWPLATYDGVAAIFVQFADPAMRQRLFAHIITCLKPGGTLLLLGYTPKQLDYRSGGPPLLSHLYTADLLREAFAELELLALHEYEAEITEGPGHSGHAALIGLVAKRL